MLLPTDQITKDRRDVFVNSRDAIDTSAAYLELCLLGKQTAL